MQSKVLENLFDRFCFPCHLNSLALPVRNCVCEVKITIYQFILEFSRESSLSMNKNLGKEKTF